MPFIEAPTTFYLGKRYDPAHHRLTDDIVYYDSRDLRTHAIVMGMTGSGKTGLCISLLEEAVLDNIPSIIIDPKGDITNLMLNFPNLQPQDFAPWINRDDAQRAGLSPEQYAADTAQRWRDGLESWGIVPDRLKWLKLAAQYSIYTPGSDSGLPISILASLRAPRDGFHNNEELHRERINGTVTALLALAGINAKPTEDIEHVLIANIFEFNWRQGRDLTLEDIILQVQQPPFEKVGVLATDAFMSEKKRYALAMKLNAIVASPSFQSWLHGEPLDIQNLLYQPNGRPRVSILYIAHLSQQEREFIITLVLENMLSWMRMQNGTSSLRALLYIDEMFGYFPPYPKNPPTKEPILRLLKQARAFGVGLILATQNPGDLDYKGLSNAGTWFIGRLQSENDRRKVMSGLQSLATADNNLNLRDVEQLIADIDPRVFLMHNVHNDGGPVLMHTRWAMSYLRGPLTRQQVKYLMAAQRQQLAQRYAQNPYQQQGGYGQPPMNPYQGGGYPPTMPGYPPTMPGQPPQNPYQQQGGYPPTMPGQPPTMPGQPPQNPYQQQGGYPPTMPGQPPMMPGQPPQNPYQQQGGYPPQQPYQTGNGSYIQQGYPQAYPPQQPYQQGGGYGQQPPQTFGAQSATGGYPPQSQPTSASSAPQGFTAAQPAVPSAIQQYFIAQELDEGQALQLWESQHGQSARGAGPTRLAYQPVLLGQCNVRYQDKKTSLYTSRTYTFMIEDLPNAGLIHWEDHVAPTIPTRNVSGRPLRDDALFGDPAGGLIDEKRMKALEREMIDMIYNTANLNIPFNPHLKIYGNPDDNFSVFQSQVQQATRERRDAELDKLTQKYDGLMDKLDDKLRRKIRELEAEKKEIGDRKREEMFTMGEAAFSLLQGRTAYTLSRASRATRMRRQTDEDMQESHDVIAEIEAEMGELQQQFDLELKQLNERWVAIAHTVEDYLVTPYKKDIHTELFGVGWVPSWVVMVNGQAVAIPAIKL